MLRMMYASVPYSGLRRKHEYNCVPYVSPRHFEPSQCYCARGLVICGEFSLPVCHVTSPFINRAVCYHRIEQFKVTEMTEKQFLTYM